MKRLTLDMAKTAAVFNKQIKLKELYPTATVVGKEKVDSVDAYVLRLRQNSPRIQPASQSHDRDQFELAYGGNNRTHR